MVRAGVVENPEQWKFCGYDEIQNPRKRNSCHYIIDWNYDEDRSRISKGYGPENITRLRRFAVGLLKSKGVPNVSQKMRQLLMTPRMVLDYLKMTKNSRCASNA